MKKRLRFGRASPSRGPQEAEEPHSDQQDWASLVGEVGPKGRPWLNIS